jgi:mannose/fructose-specific phosphotransferase system component IIA
MVDEVKQLLGDGAAADLEALSVAHGEPKDAVSDRLNHAVERMNHGHGVLVLVDLQGSTPCNMAVKLKKAGGAVEVLCGLSLPMLVKVVSLDRERLTLAELAHEAAQTAIRSIRLGDGGAA